MIRGCREGRIPEGAEMEALKHLGMLLLLSSLTLAHPLENPAPKKARSVANAEATPNDIEKTIAEVQELIKSNPQYPKLTRGEILDLLENITKEESEGSEREDGKRALMVVMPFTPGNKNQMAELYTKQPVTHIIGAEPSKSTTNVPAVREQTPFSNVESLPITELFPKLKQEIASPTKPTRLEEIEGLPELVKPLPQSTKPLRRRRPELTTPKTFDDITVASPRSTTTEPPKHPNHKYPDEEVRPGEGMVVVSPPNLSQKKPTKTRKRTTTEQPEQQQPEKFNLKTSDEVFPVVALPTTNKPPAVPDVSNVADNLSPEMRDLLSNFGLLPNPHDKPTTSTPEVAPPQPPQTPDVKPESYVGFKPLPDDTPTRDDEMASFLASFGLGRGGRKQKTTTTTSKPEGNINLDVVPDQFKPVLSDIGLVEREAKKIREEDKTKHVANDNDYATEEELRKLNKLLEAVKLLEKLNGTASEDDLKKIDLEGLKELVGSLNSEKMIPLDEQGAPDPLKYDYGLSKNEVKRQEAAKEDEKQKLADLEASFGGTSESTLATLPPPTEKPPKKSGFYYLVDWNTFFDIDNTRGKRVNLRFQPKVGDPKRFLSVSVP